MPGRVVFEPGVVELSDGHIAYHRVGSAKQVVVLMHGLGDNGMCWARVASELTQDYTVLMLDSRGHGNSTMPPANQMDNPGRDIADVLDALEIERAHLVGHSLGAMAAAMFAATHSHRVSRLVLEDAPLRAQTASVPSERVAAYAEQMQHLRKLDIAQVISEGRKQHPTWDASEFPAWAEGKQQVDPTILARYVLPGWQELFDNISAPTLIIRGQSEHGSVVAAKLAQEIVSRYEHVRATTIPGAGHNVRRENFDDYVTTLSEFLQGAA